jgi:hypothetical protein
MVSVAYDTGGGGGTAWDKEIVFGAKVLSPGVMVMVAVFADVLVLACIAYNIIL